MSKRLVISEKPIYLKILSERVNADMSDAEKLDVGTSVPGTGMTTAGSAKTTTRVTATLDADTYERLKYWSQKRDMSINEYLREAIELKIRHENKDFDVPSLLVQRMNQMIDSVTTLSDNSKRLERIAIAGFDSLLGMTRGENYLLDEDDGELG